MKIPTPPDAPLLDRITQPCADWLHNHTGRTCYWYARQASVLQTLMFLVVTIYTQVTTATISFAVLSVLFNAVYWWMVSTGPERLRIGTANPWRFTMAPARFWSLGWTAVIIFPVDYVTLQGLVGLISIYFASCQCNPRQQRYARAPSPWGRRTASGEI